MFGTIYVGLSGLTAYSRGLQQVSGNVTNLNSLGYKAEDVSFTNLVGVDNSGGKSFAGGGNGAGSGVSIGEARRDFSQGELRQTERDLDLAVSGSGFLVLMNGSELLYTRTGSFEVDRDGYVVLAGTDYRLATLDEAGRATSVSIDAMRTSAPQRTTRISIADNLSSSATAHAISDVRVYDASGKEHVWKVAFSKAADAPAGEWTVTVTDAEGATVGTKTLKFMQGVVDPTTRELLFEDNAAGLSVTLDFSGNVTSFSSGSVSTLRAASVDGYKTGTITALKVTEAGQLEITYSNQQKKQLGAIALADFRDPQVLEQRGGGLLVEASEGGRELMQSGDPQAGRVMSRRLEASNVDLAQQFGDLILIQRGFQASSQIISVSNDMIQQLFGIRGQG
ncbi:MAG: flagellar hook-basal body complex protein [Pseudomonadota bacterium]|nr:flagellar hook-basal body complex protein [Pseudomonadota bacterium]